MFASLALEPPPAPQTGRPRVRPSAGTSAQNASLLADGINVEPRRRRGRPRGSGVLNPPPAIVPPPVPLPRVFVIFVLNGMCCLVA